jgi:hypothetical protein
MSHKAKLFYLESLAVVPARSSLWQRRASFYGVEEDKVLETAENELMKRDGFQ